MPRQNGRAGGGNSQGWRRWSPSAGPGAPRAASTPQPLEAAADSKQVRKVVVGIAGERIELDDAAIELDCACDVASILTRRGRNERALRVRLPTAGTLHRRPGNGVLVHLGSSRRLGRLLDRQLPEQRLQLILVREPAPDRAAVDRAAHLQRARGLDRPLVLVKGETGVVPLEAAMRND